MEDDELIYAPHRKADHLEGLEAVLHTYALGPCLFCLGFPESILASVEMALP